MQNFVDLNTEGFRKILKKHDKKLEQQTQERYLRSKVDVAAFADVTTLRRLMADVQADIVELQVRLRGIIYVKGQ